jgi:hypothetical protein
MHKPGGNQPVNPNKNVPGCDYSHPLHRLLEDSATGSRYRANRRAAISVCRSVWGRNYARPANGQPLECDEYPFASTYEGSAQSKFDSSAAPNNFSALPVDGSQNGSAGSQLKNFYLWNRILNTPTDDGFYVSINGSAGTPAPVPPIDPAAAGRINGSVVQPHQIDVMSDAQLSAEMSNLASQHMYSVILGSVADSSDYKGVSSATVVYPTTQTGYERSTNTDVVSRLLSAADAAGIRVLIELPTDDDWYTRYANDAAWLQTAAATDISFADELYSQYGNHPSFDGWYLPLTVDNIHFSAALAQTNLVNYYNTVTDGLRALTEDSPIAIAPSFDAVNTTVPGWQSSTAYAAMWGSIAAQTDIDVIDLQDGVGDGHAATSDLGTWFTAMNNAIQGAGSASDLYADTQTYQASPSGNTPMGVKNVVADLGAVSGITDAVWSSSYTGYLSPNSPFGTASSSSYGTAYAAWAKTGTGDGSDGGVPPTTPTGVTLTPVDSQSIKVTWNASTDPALPISGYTILRNGNPVATLIGSATTFTDSGLFGSSNYTYKVKAFDGAGNTSASGGNVTATTLATPSAPTDYARCGAASGSAGCAYTTALPADPTYPDTGGISATDGVYGSAAFGPAWQGRLWGEYSFTVDLGTSRTFTQIKSDWLELNQESPWDSAQLPTSVTYLVSADGDTWQQVATVSAPPVSALAKSQAYKALNLNCTARYVRVEVDTSQPGWSMLDEIEVRGT